MIKSTKLHTSAILVLMLFVLITGCKKSTDSGSTPPVPVNVTTVEKERVMFYDIYPGIVVPLNEVQLRSEVSGFITGIFFKEGDFVKKGKKLYEIDRSRYQASYEQAKANTDIAMANVERAKRYVERYSNLLQQEAIARQRYDDAQTDLQNANLQLVSAKAELTKAQTELNYSVITAPFDGIIGISQVKMGALITPGQTLLNTISSDNPMAVEIVINEKELNRFRKLAALKPGAGDSIFRIMLADNIFYPANGQIQTIDRAVDPQTGTIKVRLEFPNANRNLTAGMSCRVNVLNNSYDEQLVIPSKSLMEQMSEYFVFVVDSQKVRQTKVTLGTFLAGKAVIKDGLQEGEQIVTDGLQKLQNGSAIVISDKTITD
ncbi:MAG TPA: efflux RND transporter periplasmic adaptor subunit [Bacteroidales bacterium]|nr:efflux RND transporter periplasmic adaptor subunit [Bacteroidales bacterium]